MKDLFSKQTDFYARFRPQYPETLYRFVFEFVRNFNCAWDCATGNGQVALRLAQDFQKVLATDISEAQLGNATTHETVEYTLCPAEKTPFQTDQFDLICVGQALHWFNFMEFFSEAKRTGKQGCPLACWGYELVEISPEIDTLFFDFYENTLQGCWNPERKFLENKYREIAFPFEKIIEKDFSHPLDWSRQQFEGYLNSWSAVQKFKTKNGQNPVPDFMQKISAFWGEEEIKTINFPIFLKMGIIEK